MSDRAEQAALAIVDDLSSELLTRIREACARVHDVERICSDNDPIAEQAHEESWNKLMELQAQIPDPPRSFADIVAWAEIAFLGGNTERENGDCFEAPAAQLVKAVLKFAEVLLPERMHTQNGPGR